MTLPVSEMPTLSLLYKQGSIPSPRTPYGTDPDGSPFTANASLNDKICLIQHDITKLEVDAIVNAANKSLMGGGGVDGAIHAAAEYRKHEHNPHGRTLLQECEEHDGCDTGDAKMTEGYRLPAKKIIHAVGPIFSQFREAECRDLLKSCYRRSLELAVKEELKSIAFSALSTGIYGYPSTRASEAALEAVREFLDTGKADEMTHIIFCNFMDKDVDAYYGVIAHYFPPITQVAKPTSSDEAEPKATLDNGNELTSQLPDAPTAEPEDTTKSEEPTANKQKTDIVDDDFVVVEKDDAVAAESTKH